MTVPRLTMRNVELRALSVPLKRPIVSKVCLFDRWPLILIDRPIVVGSPFMRPRQNRSVTTATGAASARTDGPLEDRPQLREFLFGKVAAVLAIAGDLRPRGNRHNSFAQVTCELPHHEVFVPVDGHAAREKQVLCPVVWRRTFAPFPLAPHTHMW